MIDVTEDVTHFKQMIMKDLKVTFSQDGGQKTGRDCFFYFPFSRFKERFAQRKLKKTKTKQKK